MTNQRIDSVEQVMMGKQKIIGTKPKVETPFNFSECLLFLYVSTMLIVLSVPQFNAISNYFGMFVALVCIIEVGILRNSKNFMNLTMPLFGIGLFTLLTTTAVFYLPEAIIYVRRSVQIFGLLFIIFVVVRASGRITCISFGFFVGVLALAPYVFQHSHLLLVTGERLTLDLMGGEDGLNPNGYGIILNISILLAFYEIYVNGSQRGILTKTAIFVISIIVILIASYQIMFFLGSRQNQLWLFITAIGSGFAFSRGRLEFSRVIIAGVIASLVTALILFTLRDSPFVERLLNPVYVVLYGDDLDGSGYTRLYFITQGLSMFLGSPIWGYGLAGFQLHSGLGRYSHNMYIEILVNYGLLGFLLFFSYYYYSVKTALTIFYRRIAGMRVLVIWVLTAFCGIFISHVFRPVLYDKPMFIFLGTLGGLIYFFSDVLLSRAFQKR